MMGSSVAPGIAHSGRPWSDRWNSILTPGLVVLLLVLLPNAPAQAVIISTGDGQGNTTAPGNFPQFNNVGVRGSGSAVYLGDGWVLTAAHVGAGATLLDDTWYNVVPNSAVQLSNPAGAGFTKKSDLLLYQIAGRPDLPDLTINSQSPAIGWQVTMVGNGRDRSNTEPAYWGSTWNSNSSTVKYGGYIWANTSDMRWGTNVIDAISIPQGIGANSETAFGTTFDKVGTRYEAQGAPGDSGGGVFYQDTTTGAWYLSGLMFTIGTYTGQPWGISAFGNKTYSADLSIYRSEILEVTGKSTGSGTQTIYNGQFLAAIATNWLRPSVTTVKTGDLNGDGLVNGQDIALLAMQWMGNVRNTGSTIATPEPSSLALFSCGVFLSAIGLARRRRRGGR